MSISNLSRGILLPLLLFFGLTALTACSDENASVVGPAGDEFETQFPVNEDMPGVETEFSRSKAAGDIVDTAIGANFNILVKAVQEAGLQGVLESEGPFTVFAPTDAAFKKLPSGLLDQLLMPQNKDKLQQLLTYHVLAGKVTSRNLRFYQEVPTVEGSELKILRFFRLVLVNGVRVQTADVMATNGVIHIIDEVLIPEGFTLEDPPAPELNIAGVAEAAGFTTLLKAVTAAGLVGALTGDDPLTVFAPDNDAFAKLPDGLIDELLLEKNKDKLTELLLYHVTGGAIFSEDLRFVQRVDMLAGGKTTILRTFRGKVYVNWVPVTTADVAATNGVIHVINRVLIPRSFYGQLHSLPMQPPSEDLQMVEEDVR